MNLITAQQNSRLIEWEMHAAVLDTQKPIVIRDDGNDWYTEEFGIVQGRPEVRSHRPRGQGNRPCVHALREPLQCELFGRDWVAGLGWQLVLYRETGNNYVIASRRDELVTVAFDVIGSTRHCYHIPTQLDARNKFCYRLFPCRFEDDADDRPFASCWLGVWPD